MCMFCRSLFILLYLFFWPLCCLFFFDIWILITPLVSSNSSYHLRVCRVHLAKGENQTSNVSVDRDWLYIYLCPHQAISVTMVSVLTNIYIWSLQKKILVNTHISVTCLWDNILLSTVILTHYICRPSLLHTPYQKLHARSHWSKTTLMGLWRQVLTIYLEMLLHLEIDSEGRLRKKLYDKGDDFNFPIVNFPFICSNIPAAPAYGIYISQLIWYTRKLLNQGFLLVKLKSSLRKFCGCHHDLVDHYGIYVSQMTTDMFHLS